MIAVRRGGRSAASIHNGSLVLMHPDDLDSLCRDEWKDLDSGVAFLLHELAHGYLRRGGPRHAG